MINESTAHNIVYKPCAGQFLFFIFSQRTAYTLERYAQGVSASLRGQSSLRLSKNIFRGLFSSEAQRGHVRARTIQPSTFKKYFSRIFYI